MAAEGWLLLVSQEVAFACLSDEEGELESDAGVGLEGSRFSDSPLEDVTTDRFQIWLRCRVRVRPAWFTRAIDLPTFPTKVAGTLRLGVSSTTTLSPLVKTRPRAP